jgi:hypothetical protein
MWNMLIGYAATLFISAFLLFLIQPMAGKMLLPLYGGTPAIWNACMVFFQAALLCGYSYAHLAMKYLSSRRQAWLHLLLMLSGLLALPLAFRNDALPPADADPTVFLLYRLAISVGLPFFIVSSSAPVLQRWFSQTNHPAADDPYFLYAASNFGSLLALLGYPLIVEPLLPLNAQSLAWSAGYALLIIMVGTCHLWLGARRKTAPAADEEIAAMAPEASLSPSFRQQLFWLFCAFIPSSLMLGTTTFITTNLAAIPLLWVFPLALYLVTFILVFARKQLVPHALLVRLMPFAAIAFAPFFFVSTRLSEFILIPLHLGMFFLTSLFCHGELAASRPHPRHLTGFYLWMSIGGVLGGIFNALLAPVLFERVIEYPLGLLLACLLLPQVVSDSDHAKRRIGDIIRPLLLAAFVIGLSRLTGILELEHHQLAFFLLFATTGLACFSFKERRWRFALGFGVLLLAMGHVADRVQGEQVYASRNFYGVKRVVANAQAGIRYLYHGTTVHGSQWLASDRGITPLTYYHRSGPVGDIFGDRDSTAVKKHVAVIGLGVGSLASYARPGEHFTFYEIDPEIESIARNERFFGFLGGMQGSLEVVLGDGRLTLAGAKPGAFDIILLDAFSSDSIPVHLLTREAVALYLSKLQPQGLLVFHISNRYLNLEPLMAGLADEFGLSCLIRKDSTNSTDPGQAGKMPSDYAAMGHPGSAIQHLAGNPDWQPINPGREPLVWTDQFSNLIRLMKW